MSEDVKDDKVIKDTLAAYKIPEQWVLAARYNKLTNTVTIVTNGGKKIVHTVGGSITQKLTNVEISGFLPKEEMFWSEKLNQDVKLSELIKR